MQTVVRCFKNFQQREVEFNNVREALRHALVWERRGQCSQAVLVQNHRVIVDHNRLMQADRQLHGFRLGAHWIAE